MPLVFQYGSNCTRGRLNSPNRLKGHAEVIGPAETVEDYDIAFDVYSQTNGCAASDLVPTPGRKAWGILYCIRDEDMKILADIEGRRYEQATVRVRDRDGNEHEAITFVVKEKERRQGLATSAAYVSWIVYGLRDHGVPEDYIQHVLEVAIGTNECATASAAEETRLTKTL